MYAMNTTTIRFFYRAIEPDSLIALLGPFSALPLFANQFVYYPNELAWKVEASLARYRQSNHKNFKKMAENRDQGIGLNGSAKKRIVAVFIQKSIED